MSINDRIQQIRTAGGYTLRQFADKIGISDSAVSQIEKGKSGLSDQTIRSICREFGVNEMWLRDGIGEPYPAKSREAELGELFKSLFNESPESFRSALLTTLLKFDPAGPEWEILERIYESVASQQNPEE